MAAAAATTPFAPSLNLHSPKHLIKYKTFRLKLSNNLNRQPASVSWPISSTKGSRTLAASRIVYVSAPAFDANVSEIDPKIDGAEVVELQPLVGLLWKLVSRHKWRVLAAARVVLWPCLCFLLLMGVEYYEGYIRNSRGMKLFTCRWLPVSSPKALVFLCHGYGMECSNFMKGVGIKLASHGYAVFGLDYEGHGRSSGARCYIQRFGNIVNDCSEYYKSVCAQREYMEKRRFLYGESMGGAVALLTHKQDPSFWDGAVLVAPMCKISEKVKPHPIIISLLTRVEDVIPKWKIVPTKDVIDSAFKDPVKREDIRGNKLIYQEKPRLKTALELLRTSMNLEDSLNEVTLPFFVLHGEADTVTDPEVSRALFERASSVDKTMKTYAGMWHGLTSGEPDDNIEIVFSDILSWLDKRSGDGPTLAIESNQRLNPDTANLGGTTSPAIEIGQNQCENANKLRGSKGRRLLHSSI